MLFASESVTTGHPDKVCDRISDAVLDAFLAQDPLSRVAVETMLTAGAVTIGGEVRSTAAVDFTEVALRVLEEVGYGEYADQAEFRVDVVEQSPDIAQSVDNSLETRHRLDLDRFSGLGAGDQGQMFGYATIETASLMPMPIRQAHRVTNQLTLLHHRDPRIGPDGKAQVVYRYGEGDPELVGVVVSVQHAEQLGTEEVGKLVRPVTDAALGPLGENVRIDINPSGRFVLAGPAADTGLTGRKIIVDTYGGMARHGGGAFSGKDPSKVDRSAAYMARWAAKHVVMAGIADRVEIQVAYMIGSSEPVSLRAETFGTGVVTDEEITKRVARTFDFRPAAIIERLDLRRPIYENTSHGGHFGRDGFTWESVVWDLVDQLA